jgi:hypothetical protein
MATIYPAYTHPDFVLLSESVIAPIFLAEVPGSTQQGLKSFIVAIRRKMFSALLYPRLARCP